MSYTKSSNLGEIKLSFSDYAPSYIYLRDIGLDFATGTKEQILGVDDSWSKHGVYILLSNILNDSFEYYVGKSSNLTERLKSHTKHKLFWNKVLLIKSSIGDGFTSTEISYLESEIILTIKNWQNAKTDNKSEPKDNSITNVQKETMEHVLQSILTMLNFSGYSEKTVQETTALEEGDETTSEPSLWVVRAGEGGRLIEEFTNKKIIAIDFHDTAPYSIAGLTREEIKNNEQSGNAASQLITFRDKIKIGDYILSPYKSNTKYAVFKVTGDYRYDNNTAKYAHQRSALYQSDISSQDIDENILRSLRTILTVFKPKGFSELKNKINK